MPFFNLPGTGRVHVRMSPARSKRCKFCTNGYVEKLCDFPVGPRDKTCDAGMCARCATSISHEVDYCPKHKQQEPAQEKLF